MGVIQYESVRYRHTSERQQKDPNKFKKRFHVHRPVPDRPGWCYPSRGGVPLVVFHKDQLAANPGVDLHWFEGEEHARRMREEFGYLTTTTTHGARGFMAYDPEELQWVALGRRVYLHADADPDGENYIAHIARTVESVALSVAAVRYDDLGHCADVLDALSTDPTGEDVRRRIAQAQPYAAPGPEPGEPEGAPPRAQGMLREIIQRYPAPDFPLEVLPPALRPYVRASAEGLGVPVEMVAIPTLGITGGLVGNRLHLILKNDFRQYPALTTAIVAQPGTAKTPSLEAAARPVHILQDWERAAHATRLDEYETKRAAWKETGKQAGEPEPTRPQMRDYFSNDLTVEALADILGRVPGISVVRDELSGWVAAMDQYKGGRGSDRQQFLSLWSSQSWKIDRKKADSIYIRHPVASIVGGIQTGLVRVLHDAAGRRDGFIERILPNVPNVAPGLWSEESATLGQLQDAVALFQALDQALDHLQEAPDPSTPVFATGIGVHLSPEARTLYIAWYNQNQALIASAPPLAGGFYAKLPSQVARIALILHALWNAEDPRPMLSAERMADAIELGEFFRAHIGRFLALLEASPPVVRAGTETRITRILRKPEVQDPEGWVNRTLILDGLRTISAEALNTIRDEMVAAGTIEIRTIRNVKKSIEQWRLKPASPTFGDSGFSGYIGDEGRKPEYSETPNRHNDIPDSDLDGYVV